VSTILFRLSFRSKPTNCSAWFQLDIFSYWSLSYEFRMMMAKRRSRKQARVMKQKLVGHWQRMALKPMWLRQQQMTRMLRWPMLWRR